MHAAHVVSVSGGKDSTATYLLAVERGRPFRAVFADTGHENPVTYDYVRSLHLKTGGPEVEVYAADFSDRIHRKREVTLVKWERDGVPGHIIRAARDVLQPTGNPFLDLCLWKGRFPSTQVRFCTEELKTKVIEQHVTLPILAVRDIVRWQGERREESAARSGLQVFQRVRWLSPRRTVLIYRPIAHWTVDDVFAQHRRHGVDPNPLYLQGMGRVGCFPCIMARKGEIAQIAARYPEEIERVREWERLVGLASRRQESSFFGYDKTPNGRLAARIELPYFPGIDAVARWALQGMDADDAEDSEAAMCSSQYGLCE